MKRGIVLSLLLLSSPALHAAADPHAACADKLAQIENQGVHRDAFLQALKNIDTRMDKIPRYVFMAKLGRQREGELLVVDTHTGRVTPYKMTHGVPENAGDVLNSHPASRVYFGGARVRYDEKGHFQTGEIATEPISPSLKNKLAARNGYPELIQGISQCRRFGKHNQALPMQYVNNYCLSAEDVTAVVKLLEGDARAGNAAPVIFTYPTRNLDLYLRQVKLPNDAPNACKILERMPQPAATAPSVDAGSATDAIQ